MRIVTLTVLLALGLAPATVLAGPESVRAGGFKGMVERVPATADRTGDWTIGGRTVRVEPGAAIDEKDGPAVVGAYVEVEGEAEPDGSVSAREIEVKSPADRS